MSLDYLKGKKILLVDDEDDLLEMLLSILQDDGYRRRYVLNRWDGAFRSGKTVRIRPEHYERLRQITARSGAVSMIAYVDNVLHAHFEDYAESIDRYCRSRNPSRGRKQWTR